MRKIKILKLSIFTAAFLGVGFLGFSGQAQAKNLYVDVDSVGGNCSDSYTYEDNNITKPFCTIQKIVRVLNAGDTGVIRRGTYPEYIKMGAAIGAPVNNGETGNPITLRAAENEEVVLTYEVGKDSGGGVYDLMIYAHQISNWIFDGLIFNSPRPFKSVEHAGNKNSMHFYRGESNVIRNCKFTGNDIDHLGNAYILHIGDGGKNYVIENNSFGGYDCSYQGIYGCDIGGVGLGNGPNIDQGVNRNIVIRNNTFHGLSGDGVIVGLNGADGLLIEGNNFKLKYPGREENAIDLKETRNVVIRNNRMSGYRYKESGGGTVLGSHMGNIQNLTIENNLITDSLGGISVSCMVSACSGVKIIGNVINNIITEGQPGDAIRGNAIRISRTNDVQIYHNTIANSQHTGIYLYRVDQDTNHYRNMDIRNNIFYNNKLDIFDSYNSLSDKGRTSVGINTFYNATGEKIKHVESNGNHQTYNLAQLQSQLNQAIGSSNLDPKFMQPSVDDSVADFHLQATSPALNIGEKIAGINDDFLGTGPDLGAYEYVPPVDDKIIYVDNSASAKSTCNNTALNQNYDIATRSCGAGSVKMFTAIQGAADAAQAGYVIHVREGTYAGFAIMNKAGSANEKIIFQSHQGESVTVNSHLNIPKPNAGWRYGWEDAILIYGNSRYIEISGFTITDANPLYDSVNWADYSQGKNHVGIQMEWITNGGVADAPTYIKIYNNTIHHTGSSCILDSPESSNIEIIDNDIFDCGLSKYGYGMYINGNNYAIRGNKIHHGYGGGINFASAYTALPGSPNNGVLEQNLIYNNGHLDYHGGYVDEEGNPLDKISGFGIYLAGGGSNNVIRNNIIHSNLVYGLQNMYTLGTKIYHNTIVGNGYVDNLKFGGIYMQDNVDAIIRNNIIHNNAGINFFGNGNVQDHNLTDKNIDPKFENAANNKYNLLAGSPAIDAGIAVGVTDDFMGNTRTGLPDIGAYEYINNSADVNSDTQINIKDIQEVIRCIINFGSCNFPGRSDVNGDTRINIKDIQEIIRKIITL